MLCLPLLLLKDAQGTNAKQLDASCETKKRSRGYVCQLKELRLKLGDRVMRHLKGSAPLLHTKLMEKTPAISMALHPAPPPLGLTLESLLHKSGLPFDKFPDVLSSWLRSTADFASFFRRKFSTQSVSSCCTFWIFCQSSSFRNRRAFSSEKRVQKGQRLKRARVTKRKNAWNSMWGLKWQLFERSINYHVYISNTALKSKKNDKSVFLPQAELPFISNVSSKLKAKSCCSAAVRAFTSSLHGSSRHRPKAKAKVVAPWCTPHPAPQSPEGPKHLAIHHWRQAWAVV